MKFQQENGIESQRKKRNIKPWNFLLRRKIEQFEGIEIAHREILARKRNRNARKKGISKRELEQNQGIELNKKIKAQ